MQNIASKTLQRNTWNNAFPKPKLKNRSLKVKKIGINSKTDPNQLINNQLDKHQNKIKEIFSRSAQRKLPKFSTAPYRAYRQSKNLKEAYKNNINQMGQKYQKFVQNSESCQANNTSQIFFSNKTPSFRYKSTQRNQLMYLQPHRKYMMDKTASLFKVKSELYKQISSTQQYQNEQTQKGKKKTKIIQYLTQYNERERSPIQNYHNSWIQNNKKVRSSNEFMLIQNLSSSFKDADKGKSNSFRNTKPKIINILRQKMKNITKDSLYISKLKNIRDEHLFKNPTENRNSLYETKQSNLK